MDNLLKNLAHLRQRLEARYEQLVLSEKAQQFFFDANEAEAWMSEKELYMMTDDQGSIS
jgi:spectrin beta